MAAEIAAAAVAKNHNRPQAVIEVIDRVAQTAEHIAAKHVAGETDDKQIVGALAEDQLDRNPGMGAADASREAPLLGRAGKHANSARIEPHEAPLGAGATLESPTADCPLRAPGGRPRCSPGAAAGARLDGTWR
jgi:hypothetical protein